MVVNALSTEVDGSLASFRTVVRLQPMVVVVYSHFGLDSDKSIPAISIALAVVKHFCDSNRLVVDLLVM